MKPNSNPLKPYEMVANIKYQAECSPNSALLMNGRMKNKATPVITATIFARSLLTFNGLAA